VTQYEYPSLAQGVLSPAELRWFWMSWSTAGNISYGRGYEPGRHVIGSYDDRASFSVNYMSVGSYGVYGSHFVIPSALYRSPGTAILVEYFRSIFANSLENNLNQ